MRPETIEWIEKAEGYWHTANRENQVSDFPNFDAVCFHSQQCVEKYLKGWLVEAAIYFPKTHHLPFLLELALPSLPGIETYRDPLSRLAPYAVDLRYPGDKAGGLSAKAAFRDCSEVRLFIRQQFDLDS